MCRSRFTTFWFVVTRYHTVHRAAAFFWFTVGLRGCTRVARYVLRLVTRFTTLPCRTRLRYLVTFAGCRYGRCRLRVAFLHRFTPRTTLPVGCAVLPVYFTVYVTVVRLPVAAVAVTHYTLRTTGCVCYARLVVPGSAFTVALRFAYVLRLRGCHITARTRCRSRYLRLFGYVAYTHYRSGRIRFTALPAFGSAVWLLLRFHAFAIRFTLHGWLRLHGYILLLPRLRLRSILRLLRVLPLPFTVTVVRTRCHTHGCYLYIAVVHAVTVTPRTHYGCHGSCHVHGYGYGYADYGWILQLGYCRSRYGYHTRILRLPRYARGLRLRYALRLHAAVTFATRVTLPHRVTLRLPYRLYAVLTVACGLLLRFTFALHGSRFTHWLFRIAGSFGWVHLTYTVYYRRLPVTPHLRLYLHLYHTAPFYSYTFILRLRFATYRVYLHTCIPHHVTRFAVRACLTRFGYAHIRVRGCGYGWLRVAAGYRLPRLRSLPLLHTTGFLYRWFAIRLVLTRGLPTYHIRYPTHHHVPLLRFTCRAFSSAGCSGSPAVVPAYIRSCHVRVRSATHAYRATGWFVVAVAFTYARTHTPAVVVAVGSTPTFALPYVVTTDCGLPPAPHRTLPFIRYLWPAVLPYAPPLPLVWLVARYPRLLRSHIWLPAAVIHGWFTVV